MTRIDSLSYPLVMLVATGLFMFSAYSSFRGAPPPILTTQEQWIGVVLVLASFAATALLDAVLTRRGKRPSKILTLSEGFNPTYIHEVIHLYPTVPIKRTPSERLWDLTSASLVGQDNALALAKLRIDIEQALRELMLVRGLEVVTARSSAVKMAELLAGDVLPTELVEPIRQVLTVCNQAIHGYDVSDDLADSIVSVGDELLARLRWLIERHTPNVQETTRLNG
jgi:hypothetical protein